MHLEDYFRQFEGKLSMIDYIYALKMIFCFFQQDWSDFIESTLVDVSLYIFMLGIDEDGQYFYTH